jgi:hypothetical protein
LPFKCDLQRYTVVQHDTSAAALTLVLCGAPRPPPPASVAPRLPPAPLAGLPAVGGVGCGALVPHPGARGSRVFSLAPPDNVADIAAAAAAGGVAGALDGLRGRSLYTSYSSQLTTHSLKPPGFKHLTYTLISYFF